MCGIWDYLSKQGYKSHDLKQLYDAFMKTKGRGPDNHTMMKIAGPGVPVKVVSDTPEFKDDKLVYLKGFHRLAVMDPSSKGDQPFYLETEKRKLVLTCNGEIYNFRELIEEYELPVTSSSDCEVLLHLYARFGINKMISLIEKHAVFAIVLYDYNKKTGKSKVYAINDSIGVRPMFFAHTSTAFGFCSEMKGLTDLFHRVKRFPPGKYMTFDVDEWDFKFTTYYDVSKLKPATVPMKYKDKLTLYKKEVVFPEIRRLFRAAVAKRLHSDRPLCAAASGGFDSSLVDAVASDILRKEEKQLSTHTVCMEGGTDKPYADMVAKHCETEHFCHTLTESEFVEATDKVIRISETRDCTTVRATTGQYLLAKKIKEQGKHIVVLCGDGADELMGGYIYMLKLTTLINILEAGATDKQMLELKQLHPECLDEDGCLTVLSVQMEFHRESVRLIQDIHMYDGLRADRAVSYWGLELRIPFLDREFIDFYLQLPLEVRVPVGEEMEKQLIREAYDETDLMPKEVNWRRKEAFSDGVSSKNAESDEPLKWYERIPSKISDQEFEEGKKKYTFKTPKTKEEYLYRTIFVKYYGDQNSVEIPYTWLPRYCGDILDPSARVLGHYTA